MALPVIAARQDSDSGGAAVTSLQVTNPAGSVANSFITIIVGQDETSSVTFSATGFVEQANAGDGVSDAQLGFLTGTLSATDITNGYVTVSSTGSDEMWAASLRITGTDPTDPIHGTFASNLVASAAALTITPGSSLTTIDDCLVLGAVCTDGADMNPFTIGGTDWAGATVYNLQSGGSGNDCGGAYASIDQATAAQVSSVTFTGDGTTDGIVGIVLAIKPFSGAVVPVTGVSGTGSVGSVTVIESVGVIVPVTGLGATISTAESGGAPDVTTYYFDASDAGPTDISTSWNNPLANAFNGLDTDGCIATLLGSDSSNYLFGGGTTAPTTGAGITQVRARIFGGGGPAGVMNGAIYTSGKSELLGTPVNTDGTMNYGSYVTLSEPSGGWTWQKANDLEVYSYATLDATNPITRLTEIEVTYGGTSDPVVVTGKANVFPTSDPDAFGTGSVGDVTVDASGDIVVDVTGVSATGAVDATAVGVTTEANVSVTGVGATSTVDVNPVAVDAKANVPVTGLSATGTVDVNPVVVTTEANVDVTGVEGTGQVGSVAIEAKANVPVTGIGATGQVGTAIANVSATAAVSGVFATGNVGSVTVTGKANVGVTGVESTGQVGSVTVIAVTNVTVDVTGQVATGGIGSVEIDGKANVTVSGLEATGPPQGVTVTTEANVGVTGVVGTGEVGEVSVIAGGTVVVPVTGLEATGEVGTATPTTEQTIVVTGLSAAGAVGTVTVSTTAGIVVNVTGIEATGSVGSVTVSAEQNVTVPVTGLEATGSVGSVTVTGKALVLPTGIEATGQVGSVAILSENTIPVTGLEATGAVGSVSIRLGLSVEVTGLEATAAVGTVTTDIPDVRAYPVGVEATAEMGSVFVLAVHVPNQVPNYSEITPSDAAGWGEIDPTDSSGWGEIVPTQDPDYEDVDTG